MHYLICLKISGFGVGLRGTALAERYGDQARGRTLVAYLGSGASLCGMRDLKSVATTMGFSALDGMMMGTRCGAMDPGPLRCTCAVSSTKPVPLLRSWEAWTAGIDEHNAAIRSRMCAGLQYLGIELDKTANLAYAAVISTPASRVKVVVEPTNEEWGMTLAAHSLTEPNR